MENGTLAFNNGRPAGFYLSPRPHQQQATANTTAEFWNFVGLRVNDLFPSSLASSQPATSGESDGVVVLSRACALLLPKPKKAPPPPPCILAHGNEIHRRSATTGLQLTGNVCQRQALSRGLTSNLIAIDQVIHQAHDRDRWPSCALRSRCGGDDLVLPPGLLAMMAL